MTVVRHTIIEPGGLARDYWANIWRYREALMALAWRNVAVLYKQTLLGSAWLVVRPLIALLLFSFVFGRVARLPAEGGMPYEVLVMTGLLAWQFFSTAVTETSQSLIANPQLVSKIHFPRVILPFSAMSVPLVDLLVSAILLGLLLAWHAYLPGWQLIALPFILLMLGGLALGLGIFLAALNVRFRDVRYAVPFFLQVGLYLSPIGYSTTVIPEEYASIYEINPLVGIIAALRWSLLGGQVPLNGCALAISALWTVVVLGLSLRQFRRMDHRLADIM